jgi:anti-sigma regulatory factor (Ser/Thr protein kinase)
MGLPLMLALADEMTVSHPQNTGTSVSLSVYVD